MIGTLHLVLLVGHSTSTAKSKESDNLKGFNLCRTVVVHTDEQTLTRAPSILSTLVTPPILQSKTSCVCVHASGLFKTHLSMLPPQNSGICELTRFLHNFCKKIL